MFSRVLLVEIDTLRVDVEEATEVFRSVVVPELRQQEGFEGSLVLVAPEGKGMVVTFWEAEEDAIRAADFGTGVLERYVAMFKAPPGRDYYEVVHADLPGVLVG
jgi:hypothetical protein